MSHSPKSYLTINDDSHYQLMTGTQAIVRFTLMQHQYDSRNGINTAGFISGYRGSPLAKLDIELWKEKDALTKENITFAPGVNEELAATALWGTQQVNLFDGARYDGVFGVWYGKGAGVDRCGDVFRHANSAGTSTFGGIVAVAGDDPYAQSSSLAAQSEHFFQAMMMPILAPSSVQEILLYGLHGIAMSRFSGCWIAMKVVSDIAESTAMVNCHLNIFNPISPNYPPPEDGINIRWPDTPKSQEKRLIENKINAAIYYARKNNINSIIINTINAKIGIISSGKTYLDVREALNILDSKNFDPELAFIKLYKVGMVWPLDPEQIIQFSQGVDKIIVIEEKREFIESQVKSILYNTPLPHPYVIGKYDISGKKTVFSQTERLTPSVIAEMLLSYTGTSNKTIVSRPSYDVELSSSLKNRVIERVPHYCSGCPHSISTKLPNGSIALAGIGCHYMAKWIYPKNKTFSQMGGEGASWIGISPFTNINHVFANLGDGTYFHSGVLAIRASVAANVNITYKILYNHAVAMTGGQPVDGALTVPTIVHQLHAEGVKHIAIVTDNVRQYNILGASISHRDHLNEIQEDFSKKNGVSVIIYDQSCAIKKRRSKDNKKNIDNMMIFINEDVCDECGDCSAKSNCISITPVETEFGIKRKIDHTSCNKDISCVNGFCPSFVTVTGNQIKRKRKKIKINNKYSDWILPEPERNDIDEPYNIIIAGIGGNGITTMSSFLSAAAFAEGLGILTLDMTGISQKNGSVWSYVRLAPKQDLLYSTVINEKEAHLLLGLDIVTSSYDDILSRTNRDKTIAIINSGEKPTSEFTLHSAKQSESGDIYTNQDIHFPRVKLQEYILKYIDENKTQFIDFNYIVSELMGSDKSVNVFTLGFAYQSGFLPISETSLLNAFESDSVNAKENKESFLWGRRTANDPLRMADIITDNEDIIHEHIASKNINEIISRREIKLIEYQDISLSKKYKEKVCRFIDIEGKLNISTGELSEAIARYYFKTIAVKDEYEVARLLSHREFIKKIKDNFHGSCKINFYLSVPVFNKFFGVNKKIRFGMWILPLLRLIAKCRVLRNTKFNPFSMTNEHEISYRWKSTYEEILTELENGLNSENYHIAVALAQLPDQVRGYGLVKENYIRHTLQRKEELMKQFRSYYR
jgi:indolepyruvate ferredoxin oxidoreductase